MVGREAELQALVKRLEAAARGRPTLTVVAGEAGVGKTTLARRLAARARDERILVLWGECVPLGDGELPYAPIVGALRELLRSASGRALRAGPADELDRLLPELAHGGPAVAVSERSQARLFEQLLGLVRRLTSETPLLLVIEDLHWADPATRDLLAFAVRNLRDERVAVIATFRTDELDRSHPVRRLLGELVRREGVTQLVLARLGREEIARLIHSVLGRPAPHSLADAVFARSEGNPFYAEELLEAGGDQLPARLADALMLHVDRLDGAALDLARLLAAAGRPLGGPALAEASGLAAGELAAALRAATAAHVLVPHGDAYAFRHALMRETVYADLLPDERVTLHRRLAEAVLRHGDPAELAFHWHAAGDTRAARAADVRAGRAAAHVFAFDQALAHFERALAAADAPDRVDLLAEAATAARLTGEYDRAIELCREALALVDATAGPERAAALYERLGDAHVVDDEAALAAYRAALELLPETATAARARLIGAEGRVLTYLPRWQQARERSELALRLAQAAGARAEEGHARVTLGISLAFIGDPEAGETHLRQALTLAQDGSRPDDIARIHLALAEVLRLQGRFEAALQVTLDGCEAAARLGLLGSFGPFLELNAVEDLFRLGRWDEATARLDDAPRLDLQHIAEVLAHTAAARLAVARGEGERAREHVTRAQELSEAGISAEYVPGIYAAAAELALWDGHPEAAIAAVSRGLELIGPHENPLHTPALYALGVRAHVEAAERSRDRAAPAAAAALAERLERLVVAHSSVEAPREALAHLAACAAERGRLATKPDPAAWRALASEWDALAQPYPAAYARWREAEAVLTGDSPRVPGVEAIRAAHAAARELGAAPLQSAIEALARAARADTDAPPVPAPAPATARATQSGLSARELEVLALLAEGLTNGQIAQRLFISDRTVGVHVSNILSKLGARNRVMAASIALRQGLVSQP